MAVVGLMAVAGCQTGTLPNPNDPRNGSDFSAEILRRNLRAVTDSLSDRYAHGEFDEKVYRELVTRAANELLQGVDPSQVSPDQAWQYGEVLRDAHRWADAERFLNAAIEFARTTKNEDRRINDTLRLARVVAEQGRAEEAIRIARQTYDAPPEGSAPILLAVYLEIAPAARGHGQDVALAKLIEDAIPIHLATKVDPKSDAGRAFLGARTFHIRAAWELVRELYEGAGRDDLAKNAEKKAIEMELSRARMVGT